MKINLFLFCLLGNVLLSQKPSSFIHVDQFGYLPESTKVAVISNPQQGYNASGSFVPNTIEIRNASDNSVVLEMIPSVWNNGETHSQSGDQGWWVNFSELNEIGSYYLLDSASGERSATFEIGNGVYSDVLKAAGRIFYYNRSGIAKEATYAGQWTDAMNFEQDTRTEFIFDKGNTALFKDLSGGWFDAGDYNKYVTFAHSAVHNLLSAYEENPDAFTDAWNIPESGNDVPDVLDEIKWELDWLFKMTNEDGSVHIKMGAQNYGENAASPPSSNSQYPRYYGPTCSAASIAIASMFSHASKVFSTISQFTEYATQLQERAELCYAYATNFVNSNSLETACDDGSIVAGDADWEVAVQLENYLLAACYLFELTGENGYNDYIIANYQSLEPFVTQFWGPYKIPLYDALFNYAALSNAGGVTASAIRNSFEGAVNNNFEAFFGFNTNDLYRAFIPDYSYHWGSSQSKASYGILNTLVGKTGVSVENLANYENYVDESIHYFHGVNPQGLVYLSNMYEYGAEKSVNEIYHGWFNDNTPFDHALNSEFGPAPGFLSGGPNQGFSVNGLTPPFGQPAQKSYLDFNDGFPNNSWEISEPAIYYQAAYIRLLANRVGEREQNSEQDDDEEDESSEEDSDTMENDLDGDGVVNSVDQCPDTPVGDAVDALGCTVFSLPASNYSLIALDALCPDDADGRLEITTTESYTYTANLRLDEFESIQTFTDAFIFEDLSAGQYELCFTIEEQSNYELCFDVVVRGPQPLVVTSDINEADKIVQFTLTGGNSYTIELNGEITTTEETVITLPLQNGENSVRITTETECLGIFEETIVLIEEPLAYPNPLGNEFLNIAGLQQFSGAALIEVFALDGRRVFSEYFEEVNNDLSIDLNFLANDIYLVRVSGLEFTYLFKIIR